MTREWAEVWGIYSIPRLSLGTSNVPAQSIRGVDHQFPFGFVRLFPQLVYDFLAQTALSTHQQSLIEQSHCATSATGRRSM
jgi:hypothetical protein